MSYNGWKNYETWNVMLWINNEEPLYREACEYVERNNHLSLNMYSHFIKYIGFEDEETPDGAKWLDETLDYDRLDEAMRELID